MIRLIVLLLAVAVTLVVASRALGHALPLRQHLAAIGMFGLVQGQSVYLIDAERRMQGRLSGASGYVHTALAWSPEGNALAFALQSEGQDGQQLHMVDISGTPIGRPLTVPDPGYSNLAVSPNGAAIIAVSDYQMQLVDTATGTIRLLSDQQGRDKLPSWSPDGREIAYFSYRRSVAQLFVMDVQGDDIRQLTSDLVPMTERPVAWSPDGEQIAFVSFATGCGDIYVINRDGRGLRQLTYGSSLEFSPAWSPDGSAIAFFSHEVDGVFKVYVADLSGPDMPGPTMHALVTLPRRSWEPVGLTWSDDDLVIAVGLRDDDGDDSGVYVMRADGSQFNRLMASDGRQPLRAAWRPG